MCQPSDGRKQAAMQAAAFSRRPPGFAYCMRSRNFTSGWELEEARV